MSWEQIALTALFAIAFALVHIFIGKLAFLAVIPRSRWLSFAGGVSVSYIFLHILPELSTHEVTFAEGLGMSERKAEMWLYLASLVGLATFYGLERIAKTSRHRAGKAGSEDRIEAEVLWLHVGVFALYNILIGYLLLHREASGLWGLLTYVFAMALHFVTTDVGLREDHRHRYDHTGRWIIAGAVMLGWALGVSIPLPETAIGFLFAFLAGGVILNALKEELPEERQSRFGSFALGVTCYALILMVV